MYYSTVMSCGLEEYVVLEIFIMGIRAQLRAHFNIQSGGEIPHQPFSLPHQWNMFAPPLLRPYDLVTYTFFRLI